MCFFSFFQSCVSGLGKVQEMRSYDAWPLPLQRCSKEVEGERGLMWRCGGAKSFQDW